jgi:hypothetical protein
VESRAKAFAVVTLAENSKKVKLSSMITDDDE